MIYYAMGGGLGHLVRAKSFLHTVGFTGNATVLTASNFVADARVTSGLDVLRIPNDLQTDAPRFQRWLIDQVERLDAECLCVDAFPAGILGELCAHSFSTELKLWHVARLLRWREYASMINPTPPRYDRVWRLEPLSQPHQDFLDANSACIEDLELIDEPANTEIHPEIPFWLIVHSGPATEVSELIAFATDIRAAQGTNIRLLVATAQPPTTLPEATTILDVYPAHGYFECAERIFSAAGFNTMRQTRPYRFKHTVLPMPRRFDDQFERARRAFATS